MLKECSAVLYVDAVWVLYATLLCVLSCQANLLIVGDEEGQDEDVSEPAREDAEKEVAGDTGEALPVGEDGN